jgi:hypothetical protein
MVIYNSGTVRLNMIIAQIVGAVAFHMTMGRYVAEVTTFISKIIGKTVVFIFTPFILLYHKLLSRFGGFKEKINAKRKSYQKEKTKKKKIMNILKIHLKN